MRVVQLWITVGNLHVVSSLLVLRSAEPHANLAEDAAVGIGRGTALTRWAMNGSSSDSADLVTSIPHDFKIYVHTLPAAFNDDLVHCYKETTGVDVWDDEGKELAQNTADIWMHRILERSSLRTENPFEASVFYIPFYGFLSQHFSGINHVKGCKGKGHWQRVHDLAVWLGQNELFLHHLHRHILTVSFWGVASETFPFWSDEPFSVITGPLYDMLSKVTLLVYEPQFGSFRNATAYLNWTSPTVAIPYVANSVLVRNTLNTDLADTRKRGHKLYFRGNLRLDSSHIKLSEGEKLRNRVFSAFRTIRGARFEDSTKEFSPQAYTDGMSNASFCLVPRGDTPTSRRLFDAIMAGCIPVIVSSGIALPFETILNYSTFSVQLDEAKIDADGVYVRRYFNETLTRPTVWAMRKQLKNVQKDFMYGFGDPTSNSTFKNDRLLRNVVLSVLQRNAKLLNKPEFPHA